MTGNDMLRGQLSDRVAVQAKESLTGFLAGGSPETSFEKRFYADMENGESIVGYQYLHGTDSDSGKFHLQGASRVAARPDGRYEVVLESGYTWNDRIDPNPQYDTDVKKNKFAEIVSLGQAEPYTMRITWHSRTTVIMDQSGRVVEMHGYPG